MSKYSGSFKRSVVDSYLGGDESYASAASMHDAATVRKWLIATGSEPEIAGQKKHFFQRPTIAGLDDGLWGDGVDGLEEARPSTGDHDVANAAVLQLVH